MKKRIIALAIAALPAMMLTSCGNDDDNHAKVTQGEVLKNYADIVHQNYLDALHDAEEMQSVIEAFVAAPSQQGLEKAKKAWLNSRESYGPSEAYRFAGGPIDDENGPEGLLNAWPLDENYIDYVGSNATAGIINHVQEYPVITKELLESLNEEGGEENVSVGYHAIEFLLWGQDLTAPAANLPGQRPYTDYTTAPNAERRGQYLVIASQLITEHLNDLVNEWREGGAYRTKFLAMDKKEALTHVITGIATLSKAELAGERMAVALESKDQEDEHSCFSDNTHRDIRLNLDGIINVYNGEYKNIKGASIADLVKQKNAEVAKNIENQIKTTKEAVDATGIPFDKAISGGAESTEGAKVKSAVLNLQSLGDQLVLAGKTLGLDPSSEDE